MIKCALAKLAGAGYLDPDLINLEFWRWFPRKMNNSKNYQKDKKKDKVNFYNIFIYIYIYIYFFLYLKNQATTGAKRNDSKKPPQVRRTMQKKDETSPFTKHEEKDRIRRFNNYLKENGISYKMKNQKG